MIYPRPLHDYDIMTARIFVKPSCNSRATLNNPTHYYLFFLRRLLLLLLQLRRLLLLLLLMLLLLPVRALCKDSQTPPLAFGLRFMRDVEGLGSGLVV